MQGGASKHRSATQGLLSGPPVECAVSSQAYQAVPQENKASRLAYEPSSLTARQILHDEDFVGERA